MDNSLKTWGIYDINNNPKQSYWTFKNLNNSYCNGFYYPLVIKIDNNGNLVWAKAWLNPPLNVNSNQAKGIISYANDRFFLISFQGCYITPISNYEIIRDCDFEILSRNGKLEISSKNKHDFSVYDIQGRLIYRKLIIGKEILNMKGGIYIISVNRKFYKIIVS